MKKIHKGIFNFIIIPSLLIFFACEDLVEVDVPNTQIVSESVFNNEETALSAMQGIYNQLYSAAFCSGNENSVSVLAGLSARTLTRTPITRRR